MKFEKPINPNYCAAVVRLKSITPLEGCDNVVGTPIFGFQAIVSKSTEVGTIGIVFPVETQLSDEYCRESNLYRHAEKNKDSDAKGYLEDNRRIRAMKFRGHRSDCLFMPLESLKFTGINISDLKEGDEFDKIGDIEICKKYVISTLSRERKNKQALPRVFKRVDTKYIPEHFDSDNYFKFADQLNPEVELIVTQKLHGTSIRIANTIVKRKLNLFESVAKRFGAKIQETEFDYVFGSRKVIKDVNNPNQNHYYEVDIWTIEGKKLEGIIPQNFIVYAELIGWTPTGAPIQKDYTYSISRGQCQLYVYRVAFINEQGLVTDLSWDHVVEFCNLYGLRYVQELWRGRAKDFQVSNFLDKKFIDEYPYCVPLGDQAKVDEGVCIRVDRITPYILKAKSSIFLQHETDLLDKGEVDLETEGSTL